MVRLKHRYLLVNILYPNAPSSKNTGQEQDLPDFIQFHQPTTDAFTPQILMRAIKASAGELFGDYGVGMLSGSLFVKYLSPATSTIIIRCGRGAFRLLWASLTFITHLPPQETPCVLRVVRVSGTIRKAEEEAIRRARSDLLRARRSQNKDDDDPLAKLLGGGDGDLPGFEQGMGLSGTGGHSKAGKDDEDDEDFGTDGTSDIED